MMRPSCHRFMWRASRSHFTAAGLDRRLSLPVEPEGRTHIFNQYTVRVPDRDRIYADLRRQGYEVTLPYLPPNHLEACYAHLGHRRGDFPATESFCDELLALPCHQYLSEESVGELAERVVGLV